MICITDAIVLIYNLQQEMAIITRPKNLEWKGDSPKGRQAKKEQKIKTTYFLCSFPKFFSNFTSLNCAVFTGLRKWGLCLFPYSVLLRDNCYSNRL